MQTSQTMKPERQPKQKELFDSDQVDIIRLTGDPLPSVPSLEEQALLHEELQTEMSDILDHVEDAKNGQTRFDFSGGRSTYGDIKSLNTKGLKSFAKYHYDDESALTKGSAKRRRANYNKRIEQLALKAEKARTNDRRQADKLRNWDQVAFYVKAVLRKRPYYRASKLINHACGAVGYQPTSSSTQAKLRKHVIETCEITVFGSKNRQYWTTRSNFTTPPTKQYTKKSQEIEIKSSEARVDTGKARTTNKNSSRHKGYPTPKIAQKMRNSGFGLLRQLQDDPKIDQYRLRKDDFNMVGQHLGQLLAEGYSIADIKLAYAKSAKWHNDKASDELQTRWVQSGLIADMKKRHLVGCVADPERFRGKDYEGNDKLTTYMTQIQSYLPNLPKAKQRDFAQRLNNDCPKVWAEIDSLIENDSSTYQD